MNQHTKVNKFISQRARGVFASLFFSVPTAALLWVVTNASLDISTLELLSSRCLYGSIIIFGLYALIKPKVFPAALLLVFLLLSKLSI